jgi:hypothetical protein
MSGLFCLFLKIFGYLEAFSVFSQKARHILISAFEKWDTPKFKTFLKKKGLKRQYVKDFRMQMDSLGIW